MKDKLIRDIELKLAAACPSVDRDKVMQCVMSCLQDYEVTARETSVTVRHEDINERIMKRYVGCIRIDGKSEKTIGVYVRICKRLADFIGKPYTEMTAYDVRYFLGDMKTRGCQNSSIENARAYISALFTWMFEEDMITKNPMVKIKPIKCEEKTRLPYSSVQVDKLRQACTTLRERAVIEVLLSSGVRAEELCSLQINDLDIRTKSLIVRRGKGGKDRTTFISDVAAEYVSKYLDTRKDQVTALFLTKRGGFYTTAGLEKLILRLGWKAGVDNVHPHRFRRTFATNLYRRGMDVHEIQRLMGHSNIQTTMGYIYTDDAQIKRSYERYAA